MVLQWKIIDESENIPFQSSKKISAFSYVASNFFKMHRIETAKNVYSCLEKISAASHLYFLSPYWFDLASNSTVVLLEMFPSSIAQTQVCSRIALPSFFLYTQIVSTFNPGYSIKTCQNFHLHFVIVVDWCVNFNLQLFQIPLMEYFRFENQTNQYSESNKPYSASPECHHGKLDFHTTVYSFSNYRRFLFYPCVWKQFQHKFSPILCVFELWFLNLVVPYIL